MGPIAHLGLTETLRRETERLQSHLGETEIPIGKTEFIAIGTKEFAGPSRLDRDPIGETELIRVSGSGYVN